MKKLVSILFIAALSFVSVASLAAQDKMQSPAGHGKYAQDTVTLHFFWSKDCPHCVAAHPFIEKLKAEYPWLRVKDYEVSGNSRNGQLFEKMARQHGKETSFVPTFFVGKKMIVGYTNAETTGAEIRNAVKETHDHN